VGDLGNALVASGPLPPSFSVQRLTGTLSGSNPYTTTGDVNKEVLRANVLMPELERLSVRVRGPSSYAGSKEEAGEN
jgi:hypothetical protein